MEVIKKNIYIRIKYSPKNLETKFICQKETFQNNWLMRLFLSIKHAYSCAVTKSVVFNNSLAKSTHES